MDKLNQVADGVWVRQSEWVWTNSIVVRAEDRLILIDPGIDGSELNQLADELDQLDIPAAAGFCTGSERANVRAHGLERHAHDVGPALCVAAQRADDASRL